MYNKILIGIEGPENYYSNSTARDSSRAAWPAVPYSSIQSGESSPVTLSPKSKYSSGVTKSPPRLTLNGPSRTSLKSVPTVFPVGEQPHMSAESQARSLEYTEVVPVGRPRRVYEQQVPEQHSPDTSSPVIPLSPDPFGRFSSAELQSPTAGESGFGHNGMNFPPERMSSLTGGEATGVDERRSGVDEDLLPRMSSRFSADSLALEEQQPRADRTSRVSVKSISKLWRKSTKSSTAQFANLGGGGKVSPEPDSQSLASTSRGPSPSPILAPPSQIQRFDGSGNNPPGRVPALPRLSTSTSNVNYPSSSTTPTPTMESYYFDQESKYPVRRTPSPNQGLTVGGAAWNGVPLPSSSPPNVNPLSGASTSSVMAPPSNAGRKSILKWKSTSSNSAVVGSSSSNRSTPTPSLDGHGSIPASVQQTPAPPVRRRRPSMLDVAASMIQIAIGITVGLLMSALVVYPTGKRRSGLWTL